MADEKTKEVLELHVPTSLKNLVEALVFAAKEPLTFRQMKDIYEGEGPQAYLRQLDAEEVETSINELNAEYESAEKPYRIVRIAGGYQFATLASYADWIGRLYKEQGRRKLSQSGIESLAIIAYKQPVTKADIESIRGVNCDYVLKTLLEKELVTIVGRAHAPGRPLLYGTTREFLKHFGLNEITDLPRPREIEEILGETQFETERRMLEAQAGAEKMKEEEPEFKSRLPHIPKKKSELDKTVEIRSKTNQYELKTVKRTEVTQEIPPDVSTETVLPTVSQESAAEPRNEQIRFESHEDANLDVSVPPMNAEPPVVEKIPEVMLPDVVVESVQEIQSIEVLGEIPSTDKTEVLSEVVDASIRSEVPTATARPFDEPQVGESPGDHAHTTLDSQRTANKTKWQTWKEKVQGFIRKIFG